MNDLNTILLEGNITKDPVTRNTPNGTMICTFPVALNRFFTTNGEKDQEVSFVDIESWARLAESSATMARKGRRCRIVGRIKQDRWNGPEGEPRSKVLVVAEHIEYRPEKRRGEE